MTNTERHEARYQRRKQRREKRRTEYNKKYDNYNIMLDPLNLYNSFYECKKGVDWKWSVQYFHLHLLENINEILKSLYKNKLLSKGFNYFKINERGKIRDIQSLHIIERVQQKCLCNYSLLPIFTRVLIYDNGASMKNKGVDFARRRLVYNMTRYRRKYGANGYALIIDFSKYFANIDHLNLLQIVEKQIKDPLLMSLCAQAVAEFGTLGLGLGAQISQIFAILYPNFLDHFITNARGERYYGRYMDDSYILSPDKKHLEQLLWEIEKIIKPYKIKLNTKKTRIIKIKNGVPFLHCRYKYSASGHVIKSGGRESAQRTKRKIRYFAQLLKNNSVKITLDYVNNWYKSWRGFMTYFDSKNILLNTDIYYNKYIGGKT